MAAVLAVAVTLLGVALQAATSGDVYVGGGLTGPIYAIDATARDVAIRARSPDQYLQIPNASQTRAADPRDMLTIIAIDDRTLAELGAYNGGYPRRYYADLVDALLVAPPRVIAFDLGFFDPTPDDSQLAAAFQRAANLRVPTRIVLGAVGTSAAGQFRRRAADGELAFETLLLPVDPLRDVADIGVANVAPDERGTIRSTPLFVHIGQTEQPGFALVAVSRYLRRTGLADARPDTHTVEFAGRAIPVDDTASVKINFFGPPGEAFQTNSFVDVVRGRVDPAVWRDRLVLVGVADATGLADDFWTPVSTAGQKMSGVEIQAHVAATVFSTQFLHSAPPAIQALLLLGETLLVAGIAANLRVAIALAGSAALLAGWSTTTVGALYAFGLELPLASALMSGMLALLGVIAYRVAVEQRHGRGLQRALAAVMPPSVAEEIARDPDRVALGGARRTVTVIFADLKGFTTFSEQVEPEVVGQVITQYIDAMTQVVFRHGGTLDRFIGDSVMAFWNAPLDDADHARHACEAALEMQADLQRLSREWTNDGLPTLSMRVGINTGPAVVGRLGTGQRFVYTAHGDSINLGARLEPLNNEYGTAICISQSTFDAAGGRNNFAARFLDLVVVKGKSAPVAVYELMGAAEDHALAARYTRVLEFYDRAMVLYQGQHFEEAAQLFQLADEAGPGGTDPPSSVYLHRCEEFAITAPDPAWSGVYVMRHK